MSNVLSWSLHGELRELSAEETSTKLIKTREKEILMLWRQCIERDYKDYEAYFP